MSLKILADENVSGAVIAFLKKRHFDITAIKRGATDLNVAKQAIQERRIIVTHDSDFANILCFPPAEYFGIIRIKINPPFNKIIISALAKIFKKFKTADEFRGKLIIVDAASFRILEPSR